VSSGSFGGRAGLEALGIVLGPAGRRESGTPWDPLIEDDCLWVGGDGILAGVLPVEPLDTTDPFREWFAIEIGFLSLENLSVSGSYVPLIEIRG
jgi:hypothetical protein